jgi:hypothetical protein
MRNETRKILDMLSQGKISVDDAERLLSALAGDDQTVEGERERPSQGKTAAPKFLRIMVEPYETGGSAERVNIRVPLRLVRAGLKWASFVPKGAQKKVNESLKRKGLEMDFTKMSKEDLDELMQNLDELTVDVDGDERVRIYCE